MLRRALFAALLLAAPLGGASGQINLKKLKEALKKPADSTARRPDSTAKPPDTTARKRPDSTAKQAPKVWENYDFVPGSKVIFYTDFSEDRVGNFARGLKYHSRTAEIVERDGNKVLRAVGTTEFLIPVGKKLPQRFTLEIDAIAPTERNPAVSFEGGSELDRGNESAEILWGAEWTSIISGAFNNRNMEVKTPEALQPLLAGHVVHLRTLMDGAYFKLYVNERRVYNIPELPFRRDSVIRVVLDGAEAEGMAVFLTGIRVAESETDVLYDALTAKGRWMTQGILFATGKAELQPESGPVLKEIAGVLNQHPDLKILIEGHTDNVGTPAANLALSDARAAAVKAALLANFGADAARITTKGMGDTKPSVPNTTAAGRAQNRRVEVVKQ
jgi:OmpA-OmpF porin, OOP family